jgi:hypothetical protein
MLRKINVLSSLAWIALASAGAIGSAHASTFTVSGSGSDGALSAQADFSISNGQIIVTLTNTLSASTIVSVGQTISDVSFNLSNLAGTPGTALASGQQGNVDSGATVTYASGSPGRFIGSGGGSYTVSGDTVTLEAIGGSQPDELILPFIADGGTYASGNPGLVAHNPYTIGPATFTLALSGVTSTTTITGVTFSFGTGPDTFLSTGSNPPPPVPEPASIALLGTGMAGLAAIMRRRLVQTA